jgi:hypothetical protein
MEVKEVPVVVELDHKPVSIPDHPVEKQRAIVKPHILTHVIEGFVIQEGPEPFPVCMNMFFYIFIGINMAQFWSINIVMVGK